MATAVGQLDILDLVLRALLDLLLVLHGLLGRVAGVDLEGSSTVVSRLGKEENVEDEVEGEEGDDDPELRRPEVSGAMSLSNWYATRMLDLHTTSSRTSGRR